MYPRAGLETTWLSLSKDIIKDISARSQGVHGQPAKIAGYVPQEEKGWRKDGMTPTFYFIDFYIF